MAWPASSQTQADGLAEINREAVQLRKYAIAVKDQTASGPMTAIAALQVLGRMQEFLVVAARVKSIPGIAAFARDQLDDQGLDPAVAFVAMENAAEAVADWIVASLPAAAPSGEPPGPAYLLISYLDQDGKLAYREFPSAATAPLRLLLQDLIDSIG